MTTSAWVLFERSTGWLLVRQDRVGAPTQYELPADASPLEIARRVAAAWNRSPDRGTGLVVALESPSCLATSWASQIAARSATRQTLLYEMEERLPLAAEQLAADFVTLPPRAPSQAPPPALAAMATTGDAAGDGASSEGATTFGVAVEAAPYLPLVRALQERGVPVQTITSAALLVAQRLAAETARDSNRVLLWERAEWLEWIAVVERRPAEWKLLAKERSLLTAQLRMAAQGAAARGAAAPVSVEAYALSSEIRDALASCDAVVVTEPSTGESPSERSSATSLVDSGSPSRGESNETLAERNVEHWHVVATRAAADVLSGEQAAWIELARDGLAASDPYRPVRGLLRAAATLAALLLLTLIGTFWHRAEQYERQVQELRSRQAEAFRLALPGQAPPPGIRSRMESELAKLAAVRGSDSELPDEVSALRLLHELLAGLPETIRFRILEVRLEKNRIDLDGELRSHGDADVLASAFRARGFTVQPPHTQQLNDKTISLRLAAEWRPASSPEETDVLAVP